MENRVALIVGFVFIYFIVSGLSFVVNLSIKTNERTCLDNSELVIMESDPMYQVSFDTICIYDIFSLDTLSGEFTLKERINVCEMIKNKQIFSDPLKRTNIKPNFSI